MKASPNLMTRIGAWVALVLLCTGLGMLLAAFPRHQTSHEWAVKAGVDLATWCWLGVAFFVGGLFIGVIVKLPERR